MVHMLREGAYEYYKHEYFNSLQIAKNWLSINLK